MSFLDEGLTADAVAHLREKLKRARLAGTSLLLDSASDDSPPDEVKVVQGEASAAESSSAVIAPPRPNYQIVDGTIAESEVPAGERVFETLDDAVASLDASVAATGAQDNVSAFARARLRALLTDSSVKDTQLIGAAKQLLRDNPERRATTHADERVVFVMPCNDRGGPPPHGRVFYLRASAMSRN